MAALTQRTPLHSAHRRAGARIVEFAGWEMPVQYTGVIDEHHAVRQRAGLFDVSHMGEIEISGSGAVAFCQRVTANDVDRMKLSQAQYNLLLTADAGIVDDVIFYRLAADRFLICVNAANTEKDFNWLMQYKPVAVQVDNVSANYGQLALQGPLAEQCLQPLTSADLAALRSFYFVSAEVADVRCMIARTGYTGEKGFELYCTSDAVERLWSALLDHGGQYGLLPAGLGARDTLRLEKAYPLYGHELDESITPLEAGLDWVVKFAKAEFNGRDVLLRQQRKGVAKRLIGMELTDDGIARTGYPLYFGDRAIGKVTSGTKSPTLGKAIALGFVESSFSTVDGELEVGIRKRRVRAKVASLPFYKG